MATRTDSSGLQRKRFSIRGVVQGVGFRPFVFRLARDLGVGGFVRNSAEGVVVEAEASEPVLDRLMLRLRAEAPPLARIESIVVDELPLAGEEGFRITPSSSRAEAFSLISPDVATCLDCWAEVSDPPNRRYSYPFTNCTSCGPRFTIIRDLPYDRAVTTMAPFPMCDLCRSEYENPADRRFHAEPNACPDCGPGLALVPAGGLFLPPSFTRRTGPVLQQVRALLAGGSIVAVRGLGGFQLACNAGDEEAVRALRQRKRRSDKPFALMVRDLAAAERLCVISEPERALLVSPERPIVILARRPDASLSGAVAPDNDTVGLMLPYTPLHQMLFAPDQETVLVMTSGNMSEEPIVTSNEEAWARLGAVADFFLFHDREIHTRVDDSVARVVASAPRIIRRSRSFAPQPIDLGEVMPELLACGAELKNTFCLTKERFAILSQHIGDLSNYETMCFFEETLAHMRRLFRVTPRAIVHDLHPLYMSTRFAHQSGLPRIAVQHHHAHIASCMAENGVRERVIGVALDGTGYGFDGKIWGGEFFTGDRGGFVRRAHLRYVPLAGGDAAIRQPWRSALSYLRDSVAKDSWIRLPVSDRERTLVETMLDQNLATFETSSCGRLFDAVASLAGVRQQINFEAQAAIDLEVVSDRACQERYPFLIDESADPWQIDFRPMIGRVVEDVRTGAGAGRIGARFHNTLAEAVAETCGRIAEGEGLDLVCLSGGVFQNALLLERTVTDLNRRGLEVVLHSRVPCNDGGISLGQVTLAAERLKRGEGVCL